LFACFFLFLFFSLACCEYESALFFLSTSIPLSGLNKRLLTLPFSFFTFFDQCYVSTTTTAQLSFRFREHLQEHLRDRRRSRMPFRDHLDTALARLRSRSPLVPGIGDGGSISSEASGERESDSGEEGRRGEDHWEDAVEHGEEEEQPEEYESGVLFQERAIGRRISG
jgi:hypothetical protein